MHVEFRYKAVVEGDAQNGSLMAGQVVGQLQSIRSIKEVLAEMMIEGEAALQAVNLNYGENR